MGKPDNACGQIPQAQRCYAAAIDGRFYTVLNIDDMKYWTMGAPIPETILINRKHLTPFADPPPTN